MTCGICYDVGLGRFCKLPGSLIETLHDARCVVIFTGAGVSQESGIPTFRDRQTDLWANFDAAELATPAAFDRDAESLPVEEWRRLRMPRVLPALLERAWP